MIEWKGAWPMAVLQTGENPLWFILTENGPVHIETIEEAVFSSSLNPWPHALYIRFMKKKGDDLFLVVNRDGFLKLSPNTEKVSGADKSNVAVYRFSGDVFKNFTTGGFVFYDDPREASLEVQPVAVLYLDDRFLESDTHAVSFAVPQPRCWTFNMNSNSVFPVSIRALELFSEDENWNIDTLRLADDGFYYYRAAKKDANQAALMYRVDSLNSLTKGAQISIDAFYNSAPRKAQIDHPLLPALPEGFVYTGIETVSNSLFASWEEQADYSIGAAGFVMIKN